MRRAALRLRRQLPGQGRTREWRCALRAEQNLETEVTTMKTMKALWQRGGELGLGLSMAFASGAALAVNDLPGGPAVNQIDLHPAVTSIAREQQWLHSFMLVICLLIFIAVFGVMFYSIFKHRKSKGAVSANFHESTTVEVIWTVVPFIIVILMALPATKTVVAMKDTSAADVTDQGHRHPVEVGLRLPQRRRRGIGFVSTLDVTQREMSDCRQTRGDDYLLKVDNPLWCGQQEDPHHHDRLRRDPRLHGAGLRHQAGSRSPASCATPGSRPRRSATTTASARAVRQGTRLHADPREGGLGRGLHAWVNGEKKKLAAAADDPNKVWELDELMATRREGLRDALRGLPPATGKGAGTLKPLDGSPIVLDADKTSSCRSCSRARRPTACRRGRPLTDTEIAAVVTYTKNSWSNKTGQIVQPSDVVAAQQITRSPKEHCHERSTPHPRPRARPRSRTTTTAPRTAGAAGSTRRTTRTSARCTCCSRSRCSSSAASSRCCIRAELFQPGLQFVNPQLFNQFTTMHG
jgi:cytochrome c oxidase subunit 2